MTRSKPEKERFGYRLRQRFDRFRDRSRHKSRDSLNETGTHSAQPSRAGTSPAFNLSAVSQRETSSVSLVPLNQARNVPRESSTENDEAQIQTEQTSPHGNSDEQNLRTGRPTVGNDIGSVIVSSDLWSAAFREAVENLADEIDTATLEGKNVAQLFSELEEIEKEKTNESAFLRGVRYLRSLQVPLERFKLALDLASPLANLDPTATTVVGVVRGVTAIAISFASADLNFANQIAEMLEQISYIDDCDTLGQKANRKDIHKALVLVYQKMLEFYKAASEMLSRKGAKFVLKMVLETDRLPNIVQDFLKCANTLRNIVQKATWEVVEDIKAMLYDHEIARWLGGDKMSRQTQYHAYLQDLLAERSCEFLLENTDFINWYNASESQQLVLLGDMGHKLRSKNEHQLPQPKVCYYYCRDDETGKATYIVSALILSLLEQLQGLKRPFFEWYKQAQASGIFDPAASIRKLEEFLEKLLQGIDRRVFVVIDGLDECDRASRNSLLRLLKTLSLKTSGLKTLLSCRPEEEILEQLDGSAKIELGPDPQRDAIIVQNTVERQLSYLSADVKALVIEKLSRLAQGSSIWTKMIIELIEVRRIRAFDPMRRFLKEIPLPRQLSDLYVTLFSRCTSDDPENEELTRTALKLLAVARRPFSILELAWAVTLGASRRVTTVDGLANLVDHQRVMSLIHPFIARVNFSELKKRQVRLVHQSVKEFVIKEWASNKPSSQGPALTATDQTIFDLRFESLEAFISGICIRYLVFDDIGNRDLFSEVQAGIAELPLEVDLFDDNDDPADDDPFPTWETYEQNMTRYNPALRGFGEFFVYASCHWLEHFGAITVEPFPSLADIENLCQARSTRLRNWIDQNCRPDCGILPRFEFNSKLYDPLGITSLYGSEAMLRHMLENSDFNKDKFLREPAMRAAGQILQCGELSRLRILFFDDKLGHPLHNLEFFTLIIHNWANHTTNHNNWDIAFDLVNSVLEKMVQEQWGNELLCMAAFAGCMPIIRRLITNAQHNAELRSELLREFRFEKPSWGKPRHQSIGEAVWGNHVDVIEYLLGVSGIEAHLRYRDSRRGENVLHLAARRRCNPEMFRLLVPRFQDGIHQADNQGITPLVRTIMHSSFSGDPYESMRIMLLQSGIDWSSYSWDGQQNPLRVAEQLGDTEMCRVLIDIGKINPSSS